MAESRGWIAHRGGPLRGELQLPGDKSISHRAIMLAAIADGHSSISGFLEAGDTRATADVFGRLGVRFETPGAGERRVHGVGLHGLQAPTAPLDCGNAGTAMRLLAGLLAGQAFDSTLTGDASLSRRPMQRVIDPLRQMGAAIDSADGLPPLRIGGARVLSGLDLHMPIASAQVKSALLLAGLYARGTTHVHEAAATRDYTERMLQTFGVRVFARSGQAAVEGGQRLRACDVQVPADFSSAAFFLVAGSIVPGSDLLLRRVGIGARRTGLLHVMRAMGADIVESEIDRGGIEPVADLRVRHASLHGVEVPPEQVSDMIDEFPALFVAAAAARGTTTIRGAAELRVKESDRIASMAQGLRALGVRVEETADGAVIDGGGLGAGEVDSHGDHRVAMAFAVAAQLADGEVRISDVENVATSFPGFDALARSVGFGLAGTAPAA